MNINWNQARILIQPGSTDMRKQINGLSIFVEEELKDNPMSGNLYMFCNKSRRRLKVIYWDRNGFCMWQKRLEQDRFPWPKTRDEVLEIKKEELFMLLDGIDFFNAHKKLKFSRVS
ncbi:MAG: IS66 family insertion sequence element accessory protein TnpB [Spirochaetota bacterium]